MLRRRSVSHPLGGGLKRSTEPPAPRGSGRQCPVSDIGEAAANIRLRQRQVNNKQGRIEIVKGRYWPCMRYVLYETLTPFSKNLSEEISPMSTLLRSLVFDEDG